MITLRAELLAARCRPTTAALDGAEATRLLSLLPDWVADDGRLVRRYAFKNYYHTMAFVNALAYLSHNEDHHPEMTVSYNTCIVRYDTHSAHGLTNNDFICAAKADALYEARA
ncbi:MULTISPECIES: 4a-hydroxytetrahydrobiopterin dehydratase [unclassified Duganella]|jgi:4a-hydroxytetrahydrobiopterin dehydratase|uniref:4a-hydroxytetrahydrobiopterin dehydratase n=1 Tax=unclassified Duganella TaxID=2636909 RepID=UPI00087EF47D|nr:MULTISPECIES: 4a-hydroxytetrahydrobiopterin dehydratase [unclassified Duganella]SDH45490.1 4a-hydroxytetrahydrobiopterin dehydratase [Duganella sp. OV458]SDK57062.1 4a-hydroxytetrahydrobiopterin dehydratase [Duganella sp. OV510]